MDAHAHVQPSLWTEARHRLPHDVGISLGRLASLACGVYGHLILSMQGPGGDAVRLAMRAIPCAELKDGDVKVHKALIDLIDQSRATAVTIEAAGSGLPRFQAETCELSFTREAHVGRVAAKTIARALQGLVMQQGLVYPVMVLGVVKYYQAMQVSDCEGEVAAVQLGLFEGRAKSVQRQQLVEGVVNAPLRELRELVLASLGLTSRAALSSDVRVRSVLLTGPAGSGKTWVVKRLLSELQGPPYGVAGRYYAVATEIVGRVAGLLTGEEGGIDGPRLVVVDDVDAIVPDEDEDEAAVEDERTLWELCHEVKQSSSSGGPPVCLVLVHREEAAAEARDRRLLRLKTSLYDCTVEVAALGQGERGELLGCLLRAVPLAPWLPRDVIVDRIAAMTAGFSASDLARLCETATYRALSRGVGAPAACLEWDDVTWARGEVQPAQLQGLEVVAPEAGLCWDSFGGYEDVKARLRQLIHWPLEHPGAFRRLGLHAVPGILLHGPSGCGKSMLARIIAAEARASFICVQATDVFSMYLGESEARLRALFSRARRALPCILFLDEIDAMAAKRDGDDGTAAGSVYSRVLSTLLNEMDGVQGRADGLLILAATCRKEAVDAALLRPGRLQVGVRARAVTVCKGRWHRPLLIPPTSQRPRKAVMLLADRYCCTCSLQEAVHVRLPDPHRDFLPILQVAARGVPLSPEVDLQRIVDHLLLPLTLAPSAITPAELQALCREAAMEALREDIGSWQVCWRHFETATRRLWPPAGRKSN